MTTTNGSDSLFWYFHVDCWKIENVTLYTVCIFEHLKNFIFLEMWREVHLDNDTKVQSLCIWYKKTASSNWQRISLRRMFNSYINFDRHLTFHVVLNQTEFSFMVYLEHWSLQLPVRNMMGWSFRDLYTPLIMSGCIPYDIKQAIWLDGRYW